MKDYSDVVIGNSYKQWQDGHCFTITFCVTEDCNLACRYCYMVGKNNKRRMSFETAKQIVDFVLENKYLSKEDAVVWDFIGGEPLLEIDMISKLCDYIVLKMYLTNHKWFNRYRFSFSTNGTLYADPKVQAFIDKHKGHVWFTLSIDGTKEKHDISRVKRDGSGSYDEVARNVPLWLQQFPNATSKSTFSHDDLPFLKDSIIHLWKLGIKHVMANIVYEDVWKDGDDAIYEKQLKSLADYVIDNHLWDQYGVAFFAPTVGLPVDQECLSTNRCGAGDRSLAFDCEGNIYPCIRFLEMCSSNHKKIIIGDLQNGINYDYLRSFLSLTWENQSSSDCNNCDVGKGCGWCVAYNYEQSKNDTIFERSVAICKMHKANARANKYFWDRFETVTGRTSQMTVIKSTTPNAHFFKYVNFITSDTITPHCGYTNTESISKGRIMSPDIIAEGLDYCFKNNLVPIFLGECDLLIKNTEKLYFNLVDANKASACSNVVSIYKDNIPNIVDDSGISILLLNLDNLLNIPGLCRKLAQRKVRINLFIQDLEKWVDSDFTAYEKVVNELGTLMIEEYEANHKLLSLNLISDYFDTNTSNDCGAGVTTISLAPNGKFYICPAFYFDDPNSSIGSLEDGIQITNKKFLAKHASPICSTCESNNCNRCIYLNKKMTRELHIPSIKYCKINEINKSIAERVKSFLPVGNIIN